MYSTVMRTALGGKLTKFLTSRRGQTLDRFFLIRTGFSPMMSAVSAREGFPPIPLLVIYCIGRTSGKERCVVMPDITLDGRHYVIGSHGGAPKDPYWVENLRCNPDAHIVIDRKRYKVRARILDFDSEERSRLWQVAASGTPLYQRYQDNTSRRIPVVALDLT